MIRLYVAACISTVVQLTVRPPPAAYANPLTRVCLVLLLLQVLGNDPANGSLQYGGLPHPAPLSRSWSPVLQHPLESQLVGLVLLHLQAGPKPRHQAPSWGAGLVCARAETRPQRREAMRGCTCWNVHKGPRHADGEAARGRKRHAVGVRSAGSAIKPRTLSAAIPLLRPQSPSAVTRQNGPGSINGFISVV